MKVYKIFRASYYFKITGIMLILTTVLIFSFISCNRRKQKPNIVFILADDQGWKDAGFMGSKFYETPAIDRLAASGKIFTNAYSNAPNCAPSRAALLTGLYSPRTGIYTVGSSERGKSVYRRLIPIPNKTILDTSFTTIAEVLKQNGYVCASIGKWHLGEDPLTGPLNQGFDKNIGGWHLGHPKSYFSPYGNPALEDGSKGEYLTDRLTEEAIKFIKENRSKPFFLYFPHYAVHTPLQGKDSIIQKFKNKPPDGEQKNPVYASMVKSLDESVGKIVQTLSDLDIVKNTLVIFTSDNGGYGPATSMKPLRGSKGMLYEGGIREPFIVSWPGRIKAGKKSEEPILFIDLFPTLLRITHSKYNKEIPFDGIALDKLFLKNQPLGKRPLFWYFPAYLERYKGVPDIWRTTPVAAVRYGDWKLIRFFEREEPELYNLKEDIGETNDLSKKYPEQRVELDSILHYWIKITHASVPVTWNPEFDESAYQQRLQQIISKENEKK